MENEVTPSPLSEDDALEHPEVKDSIEYCKELAAYVSMRMHDAMHNLVSQTEEKLYLLLNRVPVEDPDMLAQIISNSVRDCLMDLGPYIQTVKFEIMRALRGHIDNVQTCNLRLNFDGKIVRK